MVKKVGNVVSGVPSDTDCDDRRLFFGRMLEVHPWSEGAIFMSATNDFTTVWCRGCLANGTDNVGVWSSGKPKKQREEEEDDDDDDDDDDD